MNDLIKASSEERAPATSSSCGHGLGCGTRLPFWDLGSWRRRRFGHGRDAVKRGYSFWLEFCLNSSEEMGSKTWSRAFLMPGYIKACNGAVAAEKQLGVGQQLAQICASVGPRKMTDGLGERVERRALVCGQCLGSLLKPVKPTLARTCLPPSGCRSRRRSVLLKLAMLVPKERTSGQLSSQLPMHLVSPSPGGCAIRLAVGGVSNASHCGSSRPPLPVCRR